MSQDNYKTMRVPESAWKEAKAHKEDLGVSWGEYLRLPLGDVDTGECNIDVEDLTVSLEATEYSKIADELEGRLR